MKSLEHRTENLGSNERLVLFLGTERGLGVLRKLVKDKIGEIVAVCVQYSDGHGALASEEIAQTARDINADVYSSNEVRPREYTELIKKYDPNTALCINWRRLFPVEAVQAPHRGLLVAHDSLLPNLRGFAPLNHAIRAGETETGVTLFYANERADAGDIVGAKKTEIGPTEYVSEVRDRVTQLTVDLIAENLPLVLAGESPGTPQDESKATYGVMLTPPDGKIDFTREGQRILNLIRATSHPYPGAFADLDGKQLKIWSASIPENAPRLVNTIPGRVVAFESERGVYVTAGDGAIFLEDVELDGQRGTADQFIKSYSKTLR